MDYKLTVADALIAEAPTLEEAVSMAQDIHDPTYGEDVAIWEASKLVAVLQAAGSLWLPPGMVVSLNPVSAR